MYMCNVTGEIEGLYEFYINRDFGQRAEYLTDSQFSFNLSHDEFYKFSEKGKNEVGLVEEDYTYQHNKYYSSSDIYDLIQTFKYVPNGYYSDGWYQLNAEEEQWQWENKDTAIIEFVEYERLDDIAIAFSKEQLSEAISRRFPDRHNPYKLIKVKYIDYLQSITKEELIDLFVKNANESKWSLMGDEK